MRRKPYPMTELLGGMSVDLDPLFLTDQESPNLKMCRFDKHILKKDYAWKSFGSVSERPMLIDTYDRTDGTSKLVLFTVDKGYYWDPSGEVFTAISGSDVFTGDADDTFCSCIFNDLFIISNFKDVVYKWDGTTFSALGGLSSPDIRGKVLIPYYNHLLMGFTNESTADCPQRVRWSDTGDPEEWDDTDLSKNAGYVDLSDTPDWITQFALLRDRLFVFKERSIWEITHVGGTDVFEPRLIIDGVGCWASGTIVNLGEQLIFYGSDNVYLFDGMTLTPVGDALYPLFYETENRIVNADKIQRAVGEYIEELGDYVLCLPTEGDDPNWFLRYNINEKTWIQRDSETVAIGLYSKGDLTIWDSATGAWDDSQWQRSWDSLRVPPGTPITLFAQADGTVLQDDRSEESSDLMVWESKDLLLGHEERFIALRVIAKGDGFDVSYSTNGGFSWSEEKTLTPDSDVYTELTWHFDVTCRVIRFRIRSRNGDVNVKYLEPWYVPRVRSEGGM